LKVAVLTGGIGQERAVSLQSGSCVGAALEEAGFEVVLVDVAPSRLDILDDDTVDVFFVALHGRFGEDGQLQQILADKSLVYTGSGPEASRRAFDKMVGKRSFIRAGVHVPAAIEFDGDIGADELGAKLSDASGKYVVKPITQGSSVGVEIVDGAQETIPAAQECLNAFGDCMIEQFIPGREITVGIVCGKALPIIEVRPRSGFYNYDAKYLDEQTEFLFDTISEPGLKAGIRADAMDCFEALGLKDFARIDFILGKDNIAYALEANTIPGFTTHSLLPMAAAKAGFSMSRLCSTIVEVALESENEVTIEK